MRARRIFPLLLLALAAPMPGAHGTLAGQVTAVADYVPPVLQNHAFPLSLRSFMRAEEVVGQSPAGVSWTDDSRWIYFTWVPAGEEWNAERQLWRVAAEGGEAELIDDPLVADSLQLTFAGGDLNSDRSLRVTSWRGDLYLVDRSSLSVRRLTDTRDSKSSPLFSADGREIFFTQDGQIFSLELETGSVTQLTDIRDGAASEDDEAEGHRAFLEEQQRELFAHIRRRAEEEDREEALEELRRTRERTQTVYTAPNGRPGNLTIDRRGQVVAVTAITPSQGTRPAGVPQWITEDGFTSLNPVRTKVGDAVGATRVGIHPVGSDTIFWLDVAEAVKAHAELHPPEGTHLPEQHDSVKAGDVRVQSVQFREWNDAGTHGLVSAGSHDNKHRWILSVEAEGGALSVLHHLADSAWVGGPCSGCMGWLPDQDRAWFVSEATRFAHLNVVNADGSGRRALTAGEWEVHQVEIPEQRTHFHLRTSEGSPFEQHFYRMDFDGGNRTRITEGTGHFAATVSPDGERLAVLHSTQTRPTELFTAPNRPGAEMTQITTSPSEEWLAFPWIRAEIIHFEARDGTDVPARIYRPSDMGVEANGAAVLFVHGAGYLQNVHEWWSSYYREYMFHHFLAAQGFTVLDVDYRGSAGYGRDWRTAIYRFMGGKDLSDYTDSVEWLVANEGIDPARIGLYGGSYGGFITLMALFTEPDVFTAGGALRSVTDWAHYNEGYTSNILNRPQDDREAYVQSSPIYHAEGLRGHLLMGHPMYDTNVHFSDIVRLSQRLIELGKENWELSVYPVENHGMVEPTSWVDQYRRIYELFWRTLSAPGCPEGTGSCELPTTPP